MRLRPVLAALAVLLTAALLAAPTASALDAATLRTSLTKAMAGAGGSSGAYARDLESGTELVNVKPDAVRIPASVEKLYITSAALLRFGPTTELTTRAVTDAEVDADGVLRGDLWLVGGGDPALTDDDLRRMASAIAAGGVERIEGGVVADDTRFDRLRGSSRTGGAADSDMGGRLGALVLGRGFQSSPATYAAQRFMAHLKAADVKLGRKPRVGAAPTEATELATDGSAPIADLIRQINVPSDNFMAEMLLKGLGAEFGDGGTTSAGAAVVRATLDDFGVRPRISDGSGLSRANRTSPRQVVRLLERMEGQETAQTWRSSLAVTGRTGTVKLRMRGSNAAGRCRVKTGTIRGVSNLAGVCTTTGGRAVAFAWLMNGVSTYGAHRIQDRMTALLARYSG